MWEEPADLWRRLKLGREEFVQRLVTTLIAGGDPPPWNSPIRPTSAGLRFLRALHELAHSEDEALGPPTEDADFVDECLLPKLEEGHANGWPDWVVHWPGRVWIVELKTEQGSHRADQLPYYLHLAAVEHPDADIDLTYLTGPLDRPGPPVADRQRYAHVTWDQALPLIEDAWSGVPEAAAHLAMVREVVTNLTAITATRQRETVIGSAVEDDVDLLALAQATARDGEQRAAGIASARQLEALRDAARAAIDTLGPDDDTRRVLPWLWKATSTDGHAITPMGEEFGYELRFSRYRTRQI